MSTAAAPQPLPAPIVPDSPRGKAVVRAVSENHRAVRARLAREAAAALTEPAQTA